MLPFNLIKPFVSVFFNFIYPNRIFLLKRNIKYNKLPAFHQYTICEGQGLVYIGSCCSFGYKLGGFHRSGSIELQARYKNSKIFIGNNVSTNNNIFICAANNIIIGDDTLIGQNVVIMDHEAHGTSPNTRRQIGLIGQVIIGKNVWIGNNVTILKNSEVGNNTIVATGAVVNGKFPANCIIGGVPAKIIKLLA
jgi:acetyltransferase-like isoleucine patch superfamily enzyme